MNIWDVDIETEKLPKYINRGFMEEETQMANKQENVLHLIGNHGKSNSN